MPRPASSFFNLSIPMHARKYRREFWNGIIDRARWETELQDEVRASVLAELLDRRRPRLARRLIAVWIAGFVGAGALGLALAWMAINVPYARNTIILGLSFVAVGRLRARLIGLEIERSGSQREFELASQDGLPSAPATQEGKLTCGS
jgi:hypothetical protein